MMLLSIKNDNPNTFPLGGQRSDYHKLSFVDKKDTAPSPHLPSPLGHESSEANRGRKRRNSHHSAVFGKAGNGAVVGISELVPQPIPNPNV